MTEYRNIDHIVPDAGLDGNELTTFDAKTGHMGDPQISIGKTASLGDRTISLSVLIEAYEEDTQDRQKSICRGKVLNEFRSKDGKERLRCGDKVEFSLSKVLSSGYPESPKPEAR